MKNPFLIAIFKSFDKNRIKYIVLRNHAHLPENSGGSDLDIFINKSDKKIFLNILKEEAEKAGGAFVSIINSHICPRYCLLGHSGTHWGIMIDLHLEEIRYRNQIIIPNQVMWKNVDYINGICVLNKKTDALISLLKELLNNRTCSEIYYRNFISYSFDLHFLKEIFGSIGKAEAADTLFFLNPKEFGESTIKFLVTTLDKFFPDPHLKSIRKFTKFKRLKRKAGYCITFLGTDGSGKSTIIKRITPILNEAFHNSVYYEHQRPNYIPSIAKFLGKNETIFSPVNNPHSRRPSGFIGSLFRFSYYLIDYTLGYWLKVFPKKAFKSCVWTFDRYYYDYFIDPLRARLNLPQWIFMAGRKLIPEPDLIVCFGTDARIIHKRKPELALQEVQRQVIRLKLFSSSNKRAIWIDTGKSIEDSTEETLAAILNLMSKRYKQTNV